MSYPLWKDLDALTLRDAGVDWLRLQSTPGIYRVYVDRDGNISTDETFGGDNSYIPGDARIAVLYADIRESMSPDALGLDRDGDIADGDTLGRILDEAERRYTEAVEAEEAGEMRPY